MKQELFIGWVVLRRGVDDSDVCSSNRITDEDCLSKYVDRPVFMKGFKTRFRRYNLENCVNVRYLLSGVFPAL